MNTTIIAKLMAGAEDDLTKTFLLRAVTLISFTALVFDHLLTLQDEIEYIWKRRMTPFSVLFLFNRYLAPSALLVHVVLNFSFASTSCKIDEQGYQPFFVCGTPKFVVDDEAVLLVFSNTTMLIAEAMITLRAYAVYQNSKLILCLLLPICIAHAVLLGIVFRAVVSLEITRESLGLPIVKFPMDAGIMLVAPAVLFDTVTGGLLTLGLYYRRSGASRRHMPLTRLIIQDGLLYFAVVFVNNVAWILSHVFESNKLSMANIAFVPFETWSGCITTIMIGRLTLNLRMYDPAANNELTFQTMTLGFRTSRQHTSTIIPHQDSNEEGA